MTNRYLPVTVYRNDGPDCTLDGITSHYGVKLVVPCEDGHISEEDVTNHDYVILEAREILGVKNFRPAGTKGHVMFGGNFVYTSDSRFSRTYGPSPIAVHDRFASREV